MPLTMISMEASIRNVSTRTWAARRLISDVVALAAVHGVRCTEPVLLGGATNLLVYLRPAPVVARVLTRAAWLNGDGAEAAAREVGVARHVMARGGGVVPLADELPPGPHDVGGVPVTFWRYIPASARRPTLDEAVTALAGLHAALEECPVDLPFMVPIVREWACWIDSRERAAAASPARIALLRLVHRSFMSQLEDLPTPRVAIHSDVHAGHLLSSDGGLCWIDLEHCSRGPRGWDFACLAYGRPDRDAILAAAGVPSDQARLFDQVRAFQLSFRRTDVAGDEWAGA